MKSGLGSLSGTTISVAIGLAAVLVAGFVAMNSASQAPAGPDMRRDKETSRGVFLVSVMPESEPVELRERHAWVLTVETPDGNAVTDAEVTIDGGMPAHGHGLPTSPVAAGHIGRGRYLFEGVEFNMGGLWELRFAIDAPAGSDEVTFNLEL